MVGNCAQVAGFTNRQNSRFRGASSCWAHHGKQPASHETAGTTEQRQAYADRIKPFNFLLSCHVKDFGHIRRKTSSCPRISALEWYSLANRTRARAPKNCWSG